MALAGKRRTDDLAYQREIARLYRIGFEQVLSEMDQLGQYVAKAKAAGEPTSLSWLQRQSRYLSLQSQLAAKIVEFGGDVTDLLAKQQTIAARDGITGLRSEAIRAAGVSGAMADLGSFGAATWARLDKQAFEAAMTSLTDTKSPTKQLIDAIGPDALDGFKSVWAAGFAAGHNPNKIARAAADRIQGNTQGRAQLIARTEWHRAVRTARSEAFQRSEVIKGWTWRSALDRTTCGVCYAMHGTVHPVTETLPGHPGCRCVMVPLTKDWSELGFPGIGDTRPQIESGEIAFGRLSEKRQRMMLGPSRYNIWKAGTPLRDLTYAKPNPVWGPMQRFKPLPPKGFAPPGPKGPPLPITGAGGDAVLRAQAETAIAALLRQFPGVDFGGSFDFFKSTGVHGGTSGVGPIRLSSGILDPVEWTKAIDRDLAIAQHNAGMKQFADNSVKGIINHEFGHKVFYAVMSSGHGAEFNTWLARALKAERKNPISIYSETGATSKFQKTMKPGHESFAEIYAAALAGDDRYGLLDLLRKWGVMART